MRWWDRVTTELRSLFAGTSSERWYATPTASGEPVSVERAVGLTAVWACVSLISGTIASMPLLVYTRTPDGERIRAETHPLFDVLKTRPNPVMPATAFWECLATSLLLRGNGYAMITRDDSARVRALWPIAPDRVSVEVLKTGRLRYKVTPAAGAPQLVPDGGMLHVVGPMSPDGYLGRSIISTFRECFGLALALERYGSEFFQNAATPRGILSTAARLSPTARATLTDSLKESHASPGRRHKTLVLEEGLSWTPIGMNHEDSQFLESRRFSVEEVARLFGVPAHLVGGSTPNSLTYSNSESEGLRLLKHCIGPWLARIESAVNFACISPLERRQMYAEYLPDALLSTDTTSRYAAYEVGLRSRFLTVDEVRKKENLPALVERVPVVE